MVLFLRKGYKELMNQMIYFGSESHDNLLGELAYLILGMANTSVMYFPKVIAL